MFHAASNEEYGMFSRVVSIVRNAAKNTLKNLVYTLNSYKQVLRYSIFQV